jgi:hypothetical protein
MSTGLAELLAGPSNARLGCMGGWCHIRDTCARYHAQRPLRIVERACETGHDGLARIAFLPRSAANDHLPATNSTTAP